MSEFLQGGQIINGKFLYLFPLIRYWRKVFMERDWLDMNPIHQALYSKGTVCGVIDC